MVTKGEEHMDSDDKWFNNPQIRFTITKSVKSMFVTLMQPDCKISKTAYAPCSFYLFKAKVYCNENNLLLEQV